MQNNESVVSVEELIARQQPGYTLEQPFYRDPGIFKRDLDMVVAKSWLYVAHASEIPEKGDYLLYNIGEESIILVRGRDREVRAFFNVCRHRGSHICLKSQGKVRTLTCPYHAWVYDLEGSLIGARGMPEDFDKSEFPLHGCQVRVAHGLIFICLAEEGDPAVADFEPIARDLDNLATLHRIDDTKVVHREVYPTPANWKLVVDNFRECYHCSPAHPEYTMVNAYVKAHDRDLESYNSVVKEWEGKTTELGHPVGQNGGNQGDPRQPIGYWRQPIREGFVTLSEDGQPVAPLLGDLKHWDGGETAFTFGPLSYAYLCADHLCMFRFTPVTAEHSDVLVTWHVRPDAEEGKDYDLERMKWLWDVTTVEDTRIIIDNQKGVNSSRYEPGPYAPLEAYSHDFTRWYLERLAG
ncbi:MAG: aromatic ring-hydroxylating dioxygenase subunit alpha [Alphaproteobacteria bacterium]|nr:aromatic ring-hydroxylating dioxygenase subunit alpha [Rhodospirillaceae bacterium]MBT7648273.1 aromatic ring-hydroxylating dioxygenase subunit alpha [Rhodospirillaceae bacterium]MDG2480019.1 aromatic ring-hydroxylating dioxygenase subunit alpha [Alphaproteobacteria bacterium]